MGLHRSEEKKKSWNEVRGGDNDEENWMLDQNEEESWKVVNEGM